MEEVSCSKKRGNDLVRVIVSLYRIFVVRQLGSAETVIEESGDRESNRLERLFHEM